MQAIKEKSTFTIKAVYGMILATVEMHKRLHCKLTIPLITFPNTTCLPSNHDVFTVVMKNCEPLVSLPALAMLSHPAPACFNLKFSSGKRSP